MCKLMDGFEVGERRHAVNATTDAGHQDSAQPRPAHPTVSDATMMRSWLPGRPPSGGRASDPSPPVAGGTLIQFADRKNPGRAAPTRRPRRSPVAGLLLGALVLPLTSLFAPDAEAQVLVSNMGQTPSGTTQFNRVAQPFTTGTDTAVGSVEVYIDSNTVGTLVRITPGVSGGGPDLSSSDVITLTSPTPLVANAINTFSAPPNTMLTANTTYYVVTSNSGDTTDGRRVGITNSTSDDSNPASGWSIGNTIYEALWTSTTWTQHSDRVLRIRINGPTPPDTTAPRVTSIDLSPLTSPRSSANVVGWEVTFDEVVQNADPTDFEVSNTSADIAVEQRGVSKWQVSLSGGDLADLDATITLSFASSQNIQDLASNPLANTMPTGTNNDMIIMDNTVPTVTIMAPPTSEDAFEATFTFNEPVNDFVLGDITVGNGMASDFMGADGDMTYTATITPTDYGEVTLNVAAGVATDLAGLGNTAAVQVSSTYRAPTTNTPPTATDSSVMSDEDTDHAFEAAQFSFADTDTADSLASVKIITLPAANAGTLDFDGTPIPASDLPKTVTATQLAAGDLEYTPPADAYGDAYASFTYRVNDGTDDSASIYTMTVNVSNVNDALTGSIVIVGTPKVGNTLTLDKSGLIDADGLPANDSDYYVQWLDQNNSDHHDGDGEFTYRLITSDAGRSFSVDLSFTDLGGEDEKISSALFPEMGSILENSPPTVTSIERNTPATSPTNANTLIWRVTFDEDVMNVSDGDFAVTGTTETLTFSAAPVSGSASQYDVTVGGTPLMDLDATLNLTFATGQDIQDLASNPLTAIMPTGTNDDYVVDNTAPTVASIERSNPTASPTNSDGLRWLVTFSEPVDDSTVNNADFSLAGTTATPSAAPTSFVLPISAYYVQAAGGNLNDLNDTVTLTFVSTHGITDPAGNALDITGTPVPNDNTYEMDNTAPTVTITAASTTSTGPFTATFTFNEAVTGFILGDIDVVNGSASNLLNPSSDKQIFTATISPTAAGDVTVDVAAAVAMDEAGNDNTEATQFTSNYTPPATDTTAPTVTKIERQDPTTEVTNADSLTWLVTFSESVTNVNGADFAIAGTTASLVATAVTGSTSAYEVVASGGNLGDREGTVTLSILSTNDIEDTAGLDLVTTGTPSPNENTYDLDNTAPTVTITTASMTSTAPFTATFTFNEAVTGFIAGDITVGNGDASNLQNTLADNQTFTATITPVATGDVTLNVSADVAMDDAGNGNTAASQVTISHTSNVADTIAPRVTSIARQDPTSSPTNANTLTWRVTFNENVKDVDNADFTIAGTTASLNVVPRTGSMSVYDVTASGGNLADLNGTVTLSFASAQNIKDNADNPLSNTAPTSTTNDNTYEMDNTAPTVTITVPSTSSGAFDATIVFNEAVTGFILGDIAVGNGDPSNLRNSSGDNRNFTATITPAANGDVTVDVAANAAMDPAGNGNTVATQALSTYTMSTTNNVPDKPTNLTAVPGNAQVFLSWTASASDGGSPITGHQYKHGVCCGFYSRNWTDIPDSAPGEANATSYRKTTNLINGTKYNLRVRAVNAVGESAFVNVEFRPTDTGGTAPRVASIVRRSPTTLTTSANTLQWRVTFSKDVQNVSLADFEISGATGTTLTVTPVSNSVYDVTASGGNLAGLNATVTLSLASGHDIVDSDNNALTSLMPSGTNNNTFQVENTGGGTTVPPRPTTPTGGGGGVVVVPPAPLAVTLSLSEMEIDENGGVATVTASLNRTSGTAVTVTVSAEPVAHAVPEDYVLSENPVLTIPAGQTQSTGDVTLTAVDNAVVADDKTVTVSGMTEGEGDPADPDALTLTIVNDDTRGVVVSESALDIPEGGSGTYTIVLGSEPTEAVTITPALDPEEAGIGASGSLTFTPEDWDQPQTVTVTADQDLDPDDEQAEISHAIGGGGYDDEPVASVTVTVMDDEVVSTRVDLSVSPEAVDEGAGETEVTLTARLDSGSRDTDTVISVRADHGATADATTADTAEAGADHAAIADFSITIPANSLSNTATFALTPVDDDVDEADETITLTGQAAGLAVTQGTITILDNDDMPVVTLSLSEPMIGESGGIAAVTATLNRPSSAVTTITVSAEPEAPAAPEDYVLSDNPVLTIPAGTTESTGDVTLTAVDDDVDGPDRTVTVSAAIDNELGATAPESLKLTITDDDTRGLSVSVSELAMSGGDTASYTVALDSEPTGPVSLGIDGHDGALVSVDATNLRFSRDNWSVPQPITVTAGPGSGVITLAHTASGGGYDSVAAANVTVTVTWSEAVTEALGGALDATGRMILNSAGGVFDARRREAMSPTPAESNESVARRVGDSLFGLARMAAGGYGIDMNLFAPAGPVPGMENSNGLMAHADNPVGAFGQSATDGMPQSAAATSFGSPAGATSGIAGGGAHGTGGFVRPREMDWTRMLWGRSFTLNLADDTGGNAGGNAAAGAATTSGWTLWGVADLQTADDTDAENGSHTGELGSLYLGADRAFGENWRAGLAVSQATGDVDYRVGDAAVRLDSRLTSLYPYVQGSPTENLAVWAVGGVGSGEADASIGDAGVESADLAMQYASAGFSLDVTRIGRLQLSMLGDAGQVSLSADNGVDLLSGLESDASRVRLGLEARAVYGRMQPFVQMSARSDGGTGAEATGLDVVAGLRYAAPRVSFEAQGRWFLMSSIAGYSEFSATASLNVTARSDGTGLTLKLSPAWGRTVMAGTSGVGMGGQLGLWQQQLPVAGVQGSRPGDQGMSFDSEIGYGFIRRGGGALVTPVLSLRQGMAGERITSLGVGYAALEESLGSHLRMQLLIGQSSGAVSESTLGLEVDYRF